jgi:hypothetical protein
LAAEKDPRYGKETKKRLGRHIKYAQVLTLGIRPQQGKTTILHSHLQTREPIKQEDSTSTICQNNQTRTNKEQQIGTKKQEKQEK